MLSKAERESIEIDGVIRICYDYIFAISEDRLLATHGREISLLTVGGELLCTFDSIMVPQYPSGIAIDTDGREVAVMSDVDDLLVCESDGIMGLIDYDGMPITGRIYRGIKFKSNDEVELLP